MTLRSVPNPSKRSRPTERPGPSYSGLRSRGGASDNIEVSAWCQCGWMGTVHRCRRNHLPRRLKKEFEADRSGHEAATGHIEDGSPPADAKHSACGFYHRLNDACPVPVDSPQGYLDRVIDASTTDPTRALDRLAAVHELRSWLDEQEVQAVIGTRHARCTWTEIGAAVGITKQAAWNRWGQMIGRYETAGLLETVDGDGDGDALQPRSTSAARHPGSTKRQ
jgi:hypothetical protein